MPAKVAKVCVPAGTVIVPLAVADVTIVVVPLVDPAIVNPPLPIAGVIRLGVLANTNAPVPVSSLITPASSALVVAAKDDKPLPVKATVPDAAGNVIVLVPAIAVAVKVIVPLVDPFNNIFFPAAKAICSLLVQASVASTQFNVLSVVPFTVIPAPSAVTSVGVATLANSIFLSLTLKDVELIVVVVPFTVRSPPTVTLPVVDIAAKLAVPVKVGLALRTIVPEPVSSVRALAKLALVGVAKNVATPVPKPLIPVLTGSPVALVNVTEVGVPNAGVTNVGLVANTKEPLPVSSLITPFNSELVVEAKSLNLLVVSAAVPVAAGNVIVFVPAVAVATTVIVPLVDP